MFVSFYSLCVNIWFQLHIYLDKLGYFSVWVSFQSFSVRCIVALFCFVFCFFAQLLTQTYLLKYFLDCQCWILQHQFLQARRVGLRLNPSALADLRQQEHKPFECCPPKLTLPPSLLAWLPAPAFFGMAIDMSCIWWKNVCGSKFSCRYYDNGLFRSRWEHLQL